MEAQAAGGSRDVGEGQGEEWPEGVAPQVAYVKHLCMCAFLVLPCVYVYVWCACMKWGRAGKRWIRFASVQHVQVKGLCVVCLARSVCMFAWVPGLLPVFDEPKYSAVIIQPGSHDPNVQHTYNTLTHTIH